MAGVATVKLSTTDGAHAWADDWVFIETRICEQCHVVQHDPGQRARGGRDANTVAEVDERDSLTKAFNTDLSGYSTEQQQHMIQRQCALQPDTGISVDMLAEVVAGLLRESPRGADHVQRLFQKLMKALRAKGEVHTALRLHESFLSAVHRCTVEESSGLGLHVSREHALEEDAVSDCSDPPASRSAVLHEYFRLARAEFVLRERLEELEADADTFGNAGSSSEQQLSGDSSTNAKQRCEALTTHLIALRMQLDAQLADCLAQGVDPEDFRYRRPSDS